jgi:hypothetical protein
MRIGSALCAAVALQLAATANAVVVSRTFDVTATDFVDGFGNPGGPASMLLNFSLTLDNASDVGLSVDGLTVNSFNQPYAVRYSYDAAQDSLVIATSPFLGGCDGPANSFCIFIFDAFAGDPTLGLTQVVTSQGAAFIANTRSLQFTDPGGVPEPASWAMLIAGFGLVGGAARRRRMGRVAA